MNLRKGTRSCLILGVLSGHPSPEAPFCISGLKVVPAVVNNKPSVFPQLPSPELLNQNP